MRALHYLLLITIRWGGIVIRRRKNKVKFNYFILLQVIGHILYNNGVKMFAGVVLGIFYKMTFEKPYTPLCGHTDDSSVHVSPKIIHIGTRRNTFLRSLARASH